MPHIISSIKEKLSHNKSNDSSEDTDMATFDIPKTQKAAVRVGTGEAARCPLKEIEVPTPKPHEILVKIEW
jgi:hypothetical protein